MSHEDNKNEDKKQSIPVGDENDSANIKEQGSAAEVGIPLEQEIHLGGDMPQFGGKTVSLQQPFHPEEMATPSQLITRGSSQSKIINITTEGFLNYFKNIFPHIRRVFASDLTRNLASPNEQSFLEDVKEVRGDCSQSFIVWRRSAMVLMIVPLALTAIFSVITTIVDIFKLSDFTKEFKKTVNAADQVAPDLAREIITMVEQFVEPMITAITVIKIVSLVLIGVSFLFALLALKHWSNYKKSYTYLAISWGIGFAVPFIFAVIPVRLFLKHVPPPDNINGMPINPVLLEEMLKKLELEIGMGFGMYSFIILAPAILTVFPALIRSSLYIKTLIPQSPVPGWITVTVPIFYVMLTVGFFAMLNQLAGDLIMLAALFFLLLSPLTFMFRAKKLTSSLSSEEAYPIIRRLRRIATTLMLISVVLLVVFIFNSPIIEALELINSLSFVQMSIDFVGKYFITTLVGGDIIVRLLIGLRERDLETPPTPEITTKLSGRLDELVSLK